LVPPEAATHRSQAINPTLRTRPRRLRMVDGPDGFERRKPDGLAGVTCYLDSRGPLDRDEWVGALGYYHRPLAQLHHLVIDTAQEEGGEVGKPA
jgi:hypothetical protein